MKKYYTVWMMISFLENVTIIKRTKKPTAMGWLNSGNVEEQSQYKTGRKADKRWNAGIQATDPWFFQDNGADLDIQYHMVKDLAKMTSMPFYGDSNRGTKNKTSTANSVALYQIVYCFLVESISTICLLGRNEELAFIGQISKKPAITQ